MRVHVYITGRLLKGEKIVEMDIERYTQTTQHSHKRITICSDGEYHAYTVNKKKQHHFQKMFMSPSSSLSTFFFVEWKIRPN